MDITNTNFLTSLPEISETIRDCDFIAIDTELSGLMRERSLNRFDLPEERFAKAVTLSRGHGDVDRTFSLQVHAIQFLSEHGFDFNKLFKQGVSYLTFQEKKAITAQLKSEIKNRAKVEIGASGLPKFVPFSMVDVCKEWLKKTNKFIGERRKVTTEQSNSMNTSNEFNQHNEDEQDSEMTELDCSDPNQLELRSCSNNHKRAIYKRVLECQPIYENIELGTRTDNEKNETYLVITYIDKTLKEEKQKNDMIMSKGFLEVLELIIVNKKPLVGHNLALDLIQIINQFVEPLTDDYNSFKMICHELFPLIYDTKFIAHSILEPETLTNNQSRLYDLYCQIKDSNTLPKIKMDHLGEFFDENQVPHQAGYDAYMSGYCFVGLCESYMKEMKKFKYQKEGPDCKPRSIVHEHHIISEFSNKIHLSYSYDFKYFNLVSDEEEPDRTHVFYIEFPPTWILDDLFQVFQQYGGVSVSRLTKTSALCALRDAKQVKGVMDMSKKLRDSGSNHQIHTYDTYLERYKPKKKREIVTENEDVELYD